MKPRAGSPATRRAPALLRLAPILFLLAACGGTRLRAWTGEPGPSDRLTGEQLTSLAEVRAELEAGRYEPAYELLVELQRVAPGDLTLASLRQDLELERLESGATLEELEQDLSSANRSTEGDPRTRLRRWYALRASERGTVQDLILAARIEEDELSALRLLDEAALLDPSETWAHFGRAHVLIRLDRLAEARNALEAALALDASQPRVRALEAHLMGLQGDRKAAIAAYQQWLRETVGDPRVARDERDRAVLDLVELELAEERYDSAYARLAALEPADSELVMRRLLDLVVAADGVGAFEQALSSAREAAELDPADFRPHVHQAMLLEVRFRDPEGALEAWRRAAASAGAASSAGLGGEAALQLLAAEVELARLERALGQDSPEPAP